MAAEREVLQGVPEVATNVVVEKCGLDMSSYQDLPKANGVNHVGGDSSSKSDSVDNSYVFVSGGDDPVDVVAAPLDLVQCPETLTSGNHLNSEESSISIIPNGDNLEPDVLESDGIVDGSDATVGNQDSVKKEKADAVLVAATNSEMPPDGALGNPDAESVDVKTESAPSILTIEYQASQGSSSDSLEQPIGAVTTASEAEVVSETNIQQPQSQESKVVLLEENTGVESSVELKDVSSFVDNCNDRNESTEGTISQAASIVSVEDPIGAVTTVSEAEVTLDTSIQQLQRQEAKIVLLEENTEAGGSGELKVVPSFTDDCSDRTESTEETTSLVASTVSLEEPLGAVTTVSEAEVVLDTSIQQPQIHESKEVLLEVDTTAGGSMELKVVPSFGDHCNDRIASTEEIASQLASTVSLEQPIGAVTTVSEAEVILDTSLQQPQSLESKVVLLEENTGEGVELKGVSSFVDNCNDQTESTEETAPQVASSISLEQPIGAVTTVSEAEVVLDTSIQQPQSLEAKIVLLEKNTGDEGSVELKGVSSFVDNCNDRTESTEEIAPQVASSISLEQPIGAVTTVSEAEVVLYTSIQQPQSLETKVMLLEENTVEGGSVELKGVSSFVDNCNDRTGSTEEIAPQVASSISLEQPIGAVTTVSEAEVVLDTSIQQPQSLESKVVFLEKNMGEGGSEELKGVSSFVDNCNDRTESSEETISQESVESPDRHDSQGVGSDMNPDSSQCKELERVSLDVDCSKDENKETIHINFERPDELPHGQDSQGVILAGSAEAGQSKDFEGLVLGVNDYNNHSNTTRDTNLLTYDELSLCQDSEVVISKVNAQSEENKGLESDVPDTNNNTIKDNKEVMVSISETSDELSLGQDLQDTEFEANSQSGDGTGYSDVKEVGDEYKEEAAKLELCNQPIVVQECEAMELKQDPERDIIGESISLSLDVEETGDENQESKGGNYETSDDLTEVQGAPNIVGGDRYQLEESESEKSNLNEQKDFESFNDNSEEHGCKVVSSEALACQSEDCKIVTQRDDLQLEAENSQLEEGGTTQVHGVCQDSMDNDVHAEDVNVVSKLNMHTNSDAMVTMVLESSAKECETNLFSGMAEVKSTGDDFNDADKEKELNLISQDILETDESQSSEVSADLTRSSTSATAGQELEEAIARPFNFLVKLPRFDDDKLREQIRHAQLEVNEKTQHRDAFLVQIQNKRANLRAFDVAYNAAVSEEIDARRLLKATRIKIESLQSLIGRMKNAISVEDIDARISNIEHRMQHETMPLKEEKLSIREIKQLKQHREYLSSTIGSQDEIQQALDQKDQNEDRLKALKKELIGLKEKVSIAQAAAVTVGKKYENENKLIKELQNQYRVANDVRQEAYENLLSLKKKLYEKNEHFRKYKNDVAAASDYAFCRNKIALHRLCAGQMEMMMELWNNDDEFRKDYVRCNLRSTVRRLGTVDGRSLGPDEKPPTLPSYAIVRVDKSASNPDKSSSIVENAVEKKTEANIATVVVADRKPVTEMTGSVKETAKMQELARSRLANGLASSSAADVSTRINGEKLKEKEEHDPTRMVDDWGKEVETSNLKEQDQLDVIAKEKEALERKKLQEIEKAKEAVERKKRMAEKAQIRAELRAQKEAEQREKEREKRLRKKERRAGEAPEGGNHGEILTSSESGIETVGEPAESSAAVARKPQKPSQFVKQSKSKSIPPPLRNRNRRKLQQWVWVTVTCVLVIALFLLGNIGIFSKVRPRRSGF